MLSDLDAHAICMVDLLEAFDRNPDFQGCTCQCVFAAAAALTKSVGI